MKKIELEIRKNSIVGLINEELAISFSTRVKCQREVLNIETALKPISTALETAQKEIIEKNDLKVESNGQIVGTEENKKAVLELVELQNESDNMNVDIELIKFEEKDFKNSKGEDLDIKTNISSLINDFI